MFKVGRAWQKRQHLDLDQHLNGFTHCCVIFQIVPYFLCSFWLQSFKLLKNEKKTLKCVLFIGRLEKVHSEAVEEWHKAQAPQSSSCSEACKHSLNVSALPKMGMHISKSCCQVTESFMALNVTLLTPTEWCNLQGIVSKSTYSLCATLLWKTVEREQRWNVLKLID